MKLSLSNKKNVKTQKSKKKKEKKKKEKTKRERPKIKKRTLVILAVLVLLVLLVPASGIVNGLLNQDVSEGQNTEDTGTEQGGEAKNADDIDLGELEGYLASDFIRVLKSDRYTIRYKTTAVYDGQPFEVETTFAVSGKNTAMVSSGRATIVRDEMVYMVNHTDKTIISWAVNREKGSPERIDTAGLSYQGSSGGNGLTCEEYATATSHLKLYFKEKELMKMEAKISGEDLVMNILEVKKEASDALFEVPAGYKTTNI